jgi:hypothetical protein
VAKEPRKVRCTQLSLVRRSWQVVPTEWSTWYADERSEASQRVFEAMLQMRKLDMNELARAYEGETSGARR